MRSFAYYNGSLMTLTFTKKGVKTKKERLYTPWDCRSDISKFVSFFNKTLNKDGEYKIEFNFDDKGLSISLTGIRFDEKISVFVIPCTCVTD